jgi:hypothetical protein
MVSNDEGREGMKRAVSDRELKCHEYVASIKHIIRHTGKGIFGLDKIRTQNHDELCEMFNLTKEETLKFTDNLNLEDNHCAFDLYMNLKKAQEAKEKP